MYSVLNELEQEVVVIDRQRRVMFCNDKLRIKLAYDKEEIKKLSVADLIVNYSDDCAKVYHKEELSRQIYTVKIRGKYSGDIPYQVRVIEEKWEGEMAYFLICKACKNAERQKKLARALKSEFEKRQELEEELKWYLETATDAMIVADDKGYLIKVSDSLCEMLGRVSEEMVGRHCREFMNPDNIERTVETINLCKVHADETRRLVNCYITATGEPVWMDWGIKYIKHKKIFISTARNITEQMKKEEQRVFYEKQIATENIKNEFFSNISHEFKTPINIILSTTQLIQKVLLEEEKAKDIRKYMKYIKQNGYRLLKLVNNLIDINKIEAGYYELQLGNHNIVEIVEDITQSVVQYVEGKGIELIFDTEIEEEIIACDPDKIERIMLNLLSNAAKYVSSDGCIQVNMEVKGECVRVIVSDNGTGIPQDKLESIFERFTQLDNALVRKSEGSGIGLSLVKSLVELHGGRVDVASEEGEGTQVSFDLPIKQVKESVQTQKASYIGGTKIEKCSVEFSDIYCHH